MNPLHFCESFYLVQPNSFVDLSKVVLVKLLLGCDEISQTNSTTTQLFKYLGYDKR